jgi:hypothetical protein
LYLHIEFLSWIAQCIIGHKVMTAFMPIDLLAYSQ